MKILKVSAIAAAILIGHIQASAQLNSLPVNEPDYNKPKIFTDLPEKLSLKTTNLEALLNLAVGQEINTSIAANFQLTGAVVSKSNAADVTVKSVVVKMSNRQGATFSFSRINKPDGTIAYAGRIISRAAGDVLQIIKEDSGYVFYKKNYYDLINE